MIALFGGTFDPIHFGHLRLALEACDALSADKVVFLPAGDPWQRAGGPQASGAARLAMLRLAIAAEPRFTVDDRELKRSGPTYTIDTLIAWRAEHGASQPLAWLIGADAFSRLTTWHRWQTLFEHTHFLVLARSGAAPPIAEALAPYRAGSTRDLFATPSGRWLSLGIAPPDISSTKIRTLLSAGRSPRYLLPDAVAQYICQHRLYQP